MTEKRNFQNKAKEGDFMKNEFTAKPTNFCGQAGYMVTQYHNGKAVVEQFIPETSYKAFCELTGANPVVIEEEENA